MKNGRRIVYVAGPYRASTGFGVMHNILQAASRASLIWRAGGVAICPHLNTALFDFLQPPVATQEEIIDGYVEIVRRCDAIVMTGNWMASEGAIRELKEAKAYDLKIFYATDKIIGWLKE